MTYFAANLPGFVRFGNLPIHLPAHSQCTETERSPEAHEVDDKHVDLKGVGSCRLASRETSVWQQRIGCLRNNARNANAHNY